MTGNEKRGVFVNSKESYSALDLDELDQIVGGAAAMIQNLAASLGSITALEDQKNAISKEMEQLGRSGSGCAGYAEKFAGLTSRLDALSGQQQKDIARSNRSS